MMMRVKKDDLAMLLGVFLSLGKEYIVVKLPRIPDAMPAGMIRWFMVLGASDLFWNWWRGKLDKMA